MEVLQETCPAVEMELTPAYLHGPDDGQRRSEFVSRIKEVLARDKRASPAAYGKPKINIALISNTTGDIPKAAET